MPDIRLFSIAKGTLILALLSPASAIAASVDVEWQRLGAGSDNRFAVADSWSISAEHQALLVAAEQRRYALDGESANYTHLDPGIQYLASLNDDWALWPSLRIRAGYRDTLNSKALTYNPQLAFIRSWHAGIAWVAGAGMLINDTENVLYPVFGIVFTGDNENRWSGNLTVPQAKLNYRLDDNWSLALGLKWQTRFYSQQDNDVAIIKHQDVLPSFGVRYATSDNFKVSARLTYSLAREVRLYDHTQQRIATLEPDNKAGFILGVHWQF